MICGKCRGEFDPEDRIMRLRHEHGFCISSPKRFRTDAHEQRSEGAKRGWENRRKREAPELP